MEAISASFLSIIVLNSDMLGDLESAGSVFSSLVGFGGL